VQAMNLAARIALKLVLVLPLCLATLMGPFFAAHWLRTSHGWNIPSFLVLGGALFVTLRLYFVVMKKQLRESQETWRRRKLAKQRL
jgi:hypothetical protein